MIEILIVVFVLVIVVGIGLGLYLSKYATKVDDDEYEHESGYCSDEEGLTDYYNSIKDRFEGDTK